MMKTVYYFHTIICVVFFAGVAWGESPSITGVSKFDFSTTYGLSGLTYVSGNSWLAVDDTGGIMFPLTINLNNTTGAVSSASIGTGITLNGRTDTEGIAYHPTRNTVFVSDEAGPAIAEYNLNGGAPIRTVTVPAVYNNIRPNYSLESLTMQRNGASMWTANEEALSVDGSLSTTSSGSWVRIQKFNSNFQPAGQWAYKTDSIKGYVWFIEAERSGVSDLCVLPNGQLLILERELGATFGLNPSFRNRIYLADFTTATDVSGYSSLLGSSFTAINKQLLWEGSFGTNNFEGLALGPALANNYYSLMMISDADSGLGLSVYALKIANIPEPMTLILLSVGGLIATIRHKPKK